GDDLFEARIAAQRLPTRIEADIAVRCASRDFRESFQLLNSQVVFASLRADHRIEIKDVRTIEGVFCHRQKLNGLATLAQCFVFSAESSVNQSQQAKTTSIIRARPNQFLLFLARSGKGGLRRGRISFRASDQAFRVSSAESNRPVSYFKGVRGNRRQQAISCNEVMLP